MQYKHSLDLISETLKTENVSCNWKYEKRQLKKPMQNQELKDVQKDYFLFFFF